MKLSILSDDNYSFRIDSEYLRKEYIENAEIIKRYHRGYTKLRTFISYMSGGATPLGAEYSTEGVPFLRVQNIMQNYFNLSDMVYITKEQSNEIARSRLKEGDVLLTITGVSYGKSSVVPATLVGANINQHSVKIELKEILPRFLSTFLNSRYGKLQSDKSIIGVTRPALDYTSIRNFLVPKVPFSLQEKVDNLVLRSEKVKEKAHDLYSSAESYLLECLDMQDFMANPDAYNIKTLKESFLESGRIDAEYYLPKYEDYTKAVSAYAGGVAPLYEICMIQDDNYTPEAKQAYRYIELADIGKSGDIIGCLCEKGEDLPTRARRLVLTGDVIVSSIEGSLGSCALITEDYDHALCSTGFYVVRSSQINSETLLTLFKSEPIQQLLKKGCSGTILTGIGKQEFKQIPIPLISPEVQAEIAQHIQRSFALRKEASQLLEEAKLSVEQAVEMGGGNLLIYNKLQNIASQEERLAMYLLLKDLGLLAEKSPRHKVVATEKKLSASFFASGRLDAEYYQPKYDYLDSQLSQLLIQRLGAIVDIRKSIEPGSEAYQAEGIPFVRVSDLNKLGLETPSVCLDRATYATAPHPQKDTILLSKDGSVGIAYKVEDDTDVITSGAILHLSVKEKSVLPDYLTLVLNSPIVKMQAERDAGGSIIQHWKPSEIEQVVIPILSPDIQQKLSEQVSKSFALHREANALLAEAKAMVERTIEATA